jgi:hypothetical protein
MPDSVTLEWNDRLFTQRLSAYAAQVGENAEQAVFEVAADVLADIRIGWPVDSGDSRRAWIGPRKIAPLTYQLSNPYPYARVIEYGGYPGVGPKTSRYGGSSLPGGIAINPGIYPIQRPAAPVRRALAKAYGQIGKRLQALST